MSGFKPTSKNDLKQLLEKATLGLDDNYGENITAIEIPLNIKMKVLKN